MTPEYANQPLTHLDLFSGIGGFSLAAESCGLRTVCFVERDEARQRDLAHHWPGVPLVADVNDLDGIATALLAAQPCGRHGVGYERDEAAKTAPGASNQRGGKRRALADAGLCAGRAMQWEQQGERRSGAGQCGQGASGGTVANSDGERLDGEQVLLRPEPGADSETAGCDCRPFLLTAGVPCQPASSAGKRQGSADDRWLWPQTLRVVERFRPRVCLFENPLGLASLALPAAIPGVDFEGLRGRAGRTVCEILAGLDALGYDVPRDRDGVAWIPVVPAVSVGAFHGRDRLWLIAIRREDARERVPTGNLGNATGGRVEGLRADGRQGAEPCGDVGDAAKQCLDGCGRSRGRCAESANASQLPDWRGAVLETGADGITRPVESSLCGVVARLSDWVDGKNLNYGQTKNSGTVKDLSVLRNAIGAQAIREAVGRHGMLCEEEVLLAIVRELSPGQDGCWLPGRGISDSKGEDVRDVRIKAQPSPSPPRSGHSEQCDGQLADALRELSSEIALARNRLQETAIPLLSTGVKGRVARLRGLGNAIVPQVAREIISSIIQSTTNTH